MSIRLGLRIFLAVVLLDGKVTKSCKDESSVGWKEVANIDLIVYRGEQHKFQTYVQNLALLGGDPYEGLVHEPGTLVVLNVGANLANHLGCPVAVQVVVLHLEVLTERDQDIAGLRVSVLVLNASLGGGW
ncbi:hypothetical protein BC938DRAFT_476343 [Jimgerdemannia flammicorona]|uniref:Uncharacterized protein n=1 Tax=Jimgerdemannia flammicorona TaxID=994334 RepID=A0A433QZ44_9FUNG|nr:hypothetical protein BC938DRAFT_476343 [Jimgerdemannia flammicorona]